MGETKGSYPFGEGPAKALEETLKIAEGLGFETVNVDNYAGHVEYGNGGKLYDILAHLDVVPEGDLSRWESHPYELSIRDGKMYGEVYRTIKAQRWFIVCVKVAGVVDNRKIECGWCSAQRKLALRNITLQSNLIQIRLLHQTAIFHSSLLKGNRNVCHRKIEQ